MTFLICLTPKLKHKIEKEKTSGCINKLHHKSNKVAMRHVTSRSKEMVNTGKLVTPR